MSNYKYIANGSMSGSIVKGETHLLGGQVYSELIELEFYNEQQTKAVNSAHECLRANKKRIAELEASNALKDKAMQVLADACIKADWLGFDERGYIEWAIAKAKGE